MLNLEIKLSKNAIFEKESIKRHDPPLKWNENDREFFKSHMEAPCTNKLINDIEMCFIDSTNNITSDDILDKSNYVYT